MFVFLVGRANVVHSQESESAGNSADPFRPVLPDRNMVPVIYHPDGIDQDFDRIVDSLEDTLGRVDAAESVPVVVTLYKPVESRDLDLFEMFGGSITHVYRHVTFGFAGCIPSGNLSYFVNMEGSNLVVVEADLPVEYHLDVSVPLIRARPTVWRDYGYNGSSSHSIAVIDTGIDDTHSDLGPYGDLNFSRKIVGWYDATNDHATAPQDYGEHGSHVAAITAGTGTANNLQENGSLTSTFTWFFPPSGYGYIDYLDVRVQGLIELTLNWDGPNKALLRLYDPDGSIVEEISGRSKPLTLSFNTAGSSYPTGLYYILVGNLAGVDNPFSCTETYPYQGLNDGFGLFTGVSPNSKLVGVKVFDNEGLGSSSTIMAGLDWIVANRLSYNIIVASMSLGLEGGGVDTTLDQKVDTLVQSGIVVVVSAGNDYPTYTIGSPGTAAYVITVAATNDGNGVTDYSSNGDIAKNEYGVIKPDVAAPGGTFQIEYGSLILSADSNDADAAYSGYLDQASNDYQQMGGTSMSAPHVSGTAALVVEALGDWTWSHGEALKVKMLIGMTAFETQSGESDNIPPLNRGEKDGKEGYGRICADAAIEAATMIYEIKASVSDIFGSSPSDKKVWARQVSLSNRNEYEFSLTIPPDADYDLYLYKGNPDAYGEPVIAVKSVNSTQGAMENVTYTPSSSGSYYIVAKWVSGNGEFTLQSTVKIPGDANGDTLVDVADLLLVKEAYGSIPSSANWNLNCDFNEDSVIDVADLEKLGRNYGSTG